MTISNKYKKRYGKANHPFRGLVDALRLSKTKALFHSPKSRSKSAIIQIRKMANTTIKVNEELIIQFLHHEDSNVRIAATKVVGETGGIKSVAALIAAMKNEQFQWYSCAAEALVKIGKPAVLPLIELIENNHFKWRMAPIWILGKIGDDRAIEPLLLLLKNKNDLFREKAAQALDNIGWIPGNDEEGALYWISKKQFNNCVKMGRPAARALTRFLQNENELFRFHVEKALIKIGPQAVEALTACFESGDTVVCESVMSILNKIGLVAVKPLIAALKADNVHIRKYSSLTLLKIGFSAVEFLVEALSDKNHIIRSESARLLDNFNWKADTVELRTLYYIAKKQFEKCVETGSPALNQLSKFLFDKNKIVRKKVIETIEKIGDLQSIDLIVKTLGDSSPSVRQTAIKCLAHIGTPAVKKIIPLLRSKEFYVQDAAAETLTLIGVPSIKYLIPLLHDNDEMLRVLATCILEDIDWKPGRDETGAWYWITKREWQQCKKIGPAAIKPLLNSLHNEDVDIRIGAAQTLGELKDYSVIEPLIDSLKDESKYPREAANTALKNLTSQDFGNDPEIWQKWLKLHNL